MKPFVVSALCLSLGILLSGCSAQTEKPLTEPTPKEASPKVFPSVQTAIACLPENTALIAAHRGVSQAWDLPENSASALQRLIDENYRVAEIDVASTKDGTLFLFHDGIWNDTSTGKGPVSASTTAELDSILLKSRQGTLASERPLLFNDALDMAKNKIYLEIDFKSSASQESVISAIQDKNMGDQVILIAYTAEQAAELHSLAPKMVLSAPGQDRGAGLPLETTLLWMGRSIDNLTETTDTLGFIGMIGHKAQTQNPGPRRSGKLLVTDFPEEFPPVYGLTAQSEGAYKTCLATKS